MAPLSSIVTITAVVVTLYFLIAADAWLRTKIIVGTLLLASFAIPYFAPSLDLAGLLLQVAIAIGLLMYFKAQPGDT